MKLLKAGMAFMYLISLQAAAGPIDKLSAAEETAFKILTYAHVEYVLRQPGQGCYDQSGALLEEGAERELNGFSFTCLSKSPRLPEGELAKIRETAIASGAALPVDKMYLWFPKRAADYCAQHFPGELEQCVKALDEK